MSTFPPVTSLIPHKPPMLLVDEITGIDGLKGTARAHVGADHLFLRKDGTLAPEAFCEIIAQGYAVCEAYRREQQGLTNDGGGYLVSVRGARFLAAARAGDVLEVRTEQTEDCFETRIVKGEVWRGSTQLAEATIYIFLWHGAPVGV